jgi:hypothetical protein
MNVAANFAFFENMSRKIYEKLRVQRFTTFLEDYPIMTIYDLV